MYDDTFVSNINVNNPILSKSLIYMSICLATWYTWGGWNSSPMGSLLSLGSSTKLDDTPLLTPVPLLSVFSKKFKKKGFKDAAFGEHHAAFVTGDGSVYTWGMGEYHELGVGKTGKANKPTKVKNLPPVQSVSCGQYHTMALTEDGEVIHIYIYIYTYYNSNNTLQ